MDQKKPSMSLQGLLAEPKGKMEYLPGQAFLLHVFWEAPSITAAEKVLGALKRCAEATHRDTPCVPTYYFRVSSLDASLATDKPVTVGQHQQLQEARQKLKVGVPRPAIEADLVRRGIDTWLLDADEDTPLPDSLQSQPVIIEFTELYLDRRSFYEHAGSKDYLSAYGEIMVPGLLNRQITIRIGTPTEDLVEQILVPMLKEKVEPVPAGCVLWQPPKADAKDSVLLSIDISGTADEIAQMLPSKLREECTTCIAFAHPMRPGAVRVLCVLSTPPKAHTLAGLSTLSLMGIEVHCDEVHCPRMAEMLRLASLDGNCVVNGIQAGYVLHEKAFEVAAE